MPRNRAIILLSVGHACVDVYQGAVASLVPFFIAERAYTYATVSGIVLAASLLSSVAQPLFGALTDRWALPWLLPVATILGGLGIALSGTTDSYALTLVFVAVSGIGVAAYHPESARIARAVSRGSHTAMGWFSLGGNIGFAVAPVMVAAVVATGGLRLTPLLVLPALAGSVLCLPVLRALGRTTRENSGSAAPAGRDDKVSFVKLSLAVVCRSIVFAGLSTFIALYAQQRVTGGTTAGIVALFVLYLGGAVGTVLGSNLATRWARVTVVRWSYLATVAAVAGVVFIPGPAFYLFVALASAGLYIPFSLQVTLGQDYLPTRVGTASGVTLGLSVGIGGLATPLLGRVADAASLQVALTPLIVLPVLSWLLLRGLPEPAGYQARHATVDCARSPAGGLPPIVPPVVQPSGRTMCVSGMSSPSRSDERFGVFAARSTQPLTRLAYLLCGDQHLAHDLVQTCLIRLYQAWPKLHEQESADAYARKILLRCWLNERRRPWRRSEARDGVVPDQPDITGDPAAQIGQSYEKQVLREALAKIPPRQRAAVVLRYWSQYSVTETAGILRCSEGTVKSQAARGLAAIRAAMTPLVTIGELNL